MKCVTEGRVSLGVISCSWTQTRRQEYKGSQNSHTEKSQSQAGKRGQHQCHKNDRGIEWGPVFPDSNSDLRLWMDGRMDGYAVLSELRTRGIVPWGLIPLGY